MSAGAPVPDPIGAADRELEAWKRARLAHQKTIDYKMTGWLPGMEPEKSDEPAKTNTKPVNPAKESQGRLF